MGQLAEKWALTYRHDKGEGTIDEIGLLPVHPSWGGDGLI